MMSIAREVTARLTSLDACSFSRQHLANLIWAFATLEVRTGVAAQLSLHSQLALYTHGSPSCWKRAV